MVRKPYFRHCTMETLPVKALELYDAYAREQVDGTIHPQAWKHHWNRMRTLQGRRDKLVKHLEDYPHLGLVRYTEIETAIWNLEDKIDFELYILDLLSKDE